MQNDDLAALLQPAPHRFDPHAWRDFAANVTRIAVTAHRLSFTVNLPPGLYRGLIRTRDGAFDMSTARVDMIQVPSGRKVSVGPWDLDHIHNVMAMPMAKTWINGHLLGGLWFTMPGPENIAAGRLTADFGFEVTEAETEVVLEFVEHDHDRISWHDMIAIELRTDNRQPRALLPATDRHPCLYVTAAELPALRSRLVGDPRLQALLADGPTGSPQENDNRYELDVLAGLLTGRPAPTRRAIDTIVELCRRPTWSNRPDPLLMGGDNDRGIGYKLYYTALAWDYLQESMSPAERELILARAAEYIGKMYDFTLLQRGYMGCPSSDPHSTGAWNGTAIACMAFYHDLPIARHALPLFHGLFVESLGLFPPSGKSAWATFFPFHLIRYLGAANTFANNPPELQESPFLDHLGDALLTCFRTPNTQETQRGKRTLEHRYLTAFLNRFHPTPGIGAIYHAFVEQERQAAGDVTTIPFDLLYGPPAEPPAAFPTDPYFARDTGQVFCVTDTQPPVGINFAAGVTATPRANLRLKGHNREYPQRLANFEIAQNGSPMIVDVSATSYGVDSSLANTMCLEDGGIFVQGQYLTGDTAPERGASIRRYYRGPRFIYAHALLATLVQPKLGVRLAERLLVIDRQTGTLIVSDAFAGDRAIRFGTHLHVSGSITPQGPWCHRLTGGQANLIAGIKGGDKGLTDDDFGQLFATVLDAAPGQSVQVSEAAWVPPYIYGINNGINDSIATARYPHYRRWRLQMDQPVTSATLTYALSLEPGTVTRVDGNLRLPGKGVIELAPADAEAILRDDTHTVLLGTRSVTRAGGRLDFAEPVDVEIGPAGLTCFAPHPVAVVKEAGISLTPWEPVPSANPRSHGDYQARLA